jgi:hypothetical protein
MTTFSFGVYVVNKSMGGAKHNNSLKIKVIITYLIFSFYVYLVEYLSNILNVPN